MSLFSLFKRKKKISSEDQTVIDNFSKSVDTLLSTPRERISQEEYEKKRQAERDWLEEHYDFSSIEAIAAIPERKHLPKLYKDSPTAEVYYYLRYKASLYEKEGKIELALACMRKSITLMQLRYGEWYGQKECNMLVNMLARNGYMDEAMAEKKKLDAHYANCYDRMRFESFQAVCRQAADLGTDLLIMQVMGNTCPTCARYQGRVYSISGQSKQFPPLPSFIKQTGIVHPGCHHSFFTYTHNVTSARMDYTLQLHPLKNPRYGKDIVTFSNRPFEDDRTEACKRAAEAVQERRHEEKLNKQRRDDLILESYQRQQSDYADYDWLKQHFPDKCPATRSGYRRMKTQNTKNYQALKQMAAKLGKEI